MVTIFVKHQTFFSLEISAKQIQDESWSRKKKIKAKARVQRLLVIKSCGYSMPFSMQMAIVCHTVFI